MAVLARHDNGAIAAVLPDGERRHFQHGPIDLVVEAFGSPSVVAEAYARAWRAFPDILPALVAELPALRTPVSEAPRVTGAIAAAMVNACEPFAGRFVTPMAAVAGAVADHVLAAMVAAGGLRRAYVNNGGDIALWLAEGESLTAGVVPDQDAPSLDAFGEVDWRSPVRGCRDQRLEGAQPVPWHRRQRNGAGAQCRGGRRGGNANRQCRRYEGSRDRPDAGTRPRPGFRPRRQAGDG